ncbi:hypothetical protein AB0K35_08745 [Micromonospora sp. NPDC053740]|uniref:hypothetical protein n=1 Tax=Micromonospora sp. NPDC053740 TaxID=3155173 RepID=UPI0034320651
MAKVIFFDDGPFRYFGEVSHASAIPLSSEISAEQYLSFAHEDFKSGQERGLVNAMGNAKRALHLAIDTLLHNYGLLALNKRCDFGQKLRLLDECGLISLSIFRKLNVERNVMEHEYRVPSKETVSDAIDVCQLLLLAVERLCQEVPLEGTVGVRESGKHGLFRLDRAAGRLTISEFMEPALMTSRQFGEDIAYVLPTFYGTTRTPPAEVLAEEPFFSLPLQAKQIGVWGSYLRLVVELRESFLRDSLGKLNQDTYTLGITFPADDLPSVSEFLSYLQKRERGSLAEA